MISTQTRNVTEKKKRKPNRHQHRNRTPDQFKLTEPNQHHVGETRGVRRLDSLAKVGHVTLVVDQRVEVVVDGISELLTHLGVKRMTRKIGSFNAL